MKNLLLTISFILFPFIGFAQDTADAAQPAAAEAPAEAAGQDSEESVEEDAKKKWDVSFIAGGSMDGWASAKEAGGVSYDGYFGDFWAEAGVGTLLKNGSALSFNVSNYMTYGGDSEGESDFTNNTFYVGPSVFHQFNDQFGLLAGAEVTMGFDAADDLWAGLAAYYKLMLSGKKNLFSASLYHENELGFDTDGDDFFWFSWIIQEMDFSFGQMTASKAPVGLFSWWELLTTRTESYTTAPTDGTFFKSDLIAGLYWKPAKSFRLDVAFNAVNVMVLGLDSTVITGTESMKYGAKINSSFSYEKFSFSFGFMPMYNQSTGRYQNDFDLDLVIHI